MPTCIMRNCKNHTGKNSKCVGITYHAFPKNDIEREKWRKIIAKERGENNYKPNRSSRVCSKHFRDEDMYITTKGLRCIHKQAVPSLHVDYIPIPTIVDGRIVKPSTSFAGENSPLRSADPLDPSDETQTIYIKRENDLPASIPSGTLAPLQSIETDYYKKQFLKCQQKLSLKNRVIRNLRKRNKRLMDKVASLEEVVNGFLGTKKVRKQNHDDNESESVSSEESQHVEYSSKSESEETVPIEFEIQITKTEPDT